MIEGPAYNDRVFDFFFVLLANRARELAYQ